MSRPALRREQLQEAERQGRGAAQDVHDDIQRVQERILNHGCLVTAFSAPGRPARTCRKGHDGSMTSGTLEWSGVWRDDSAMQRGGRDSAVGGAPVALALALRLVNAAELEDGTSP